MFNDTLYDPAYSDEDIDDIGYEREAEGFGGNYGEDWEFDAYKINNPKHPLYHEIMSDIADLEEF